MLSYRHGFHAGNPADVFKHAILIALVRAMQTKDKGILFVDTHAGPAFYDLTDQFTLKNREFEHGIGRLWARRSQGDQALDDYLAQVRHHNPDGRLRFYPGSPLLLRQLLRDQDRLTLCELHPTEQRALLERFAEDPRTSVHSGDGYAALARVLPPPTGRALVLIDPSFERRCELDDMGSALRLALKRCAHCVYALWYPVIEGRHTIPNALPETLQLTGEQWLDLRIEFAPDQRLGRMVGCGMAIINCPFRAREALIDMAFRWNEITKSEP